MIESKAVGTNPEWWQSSSTIDAHLAHHHRRRHHHHHHRERQRERERARARLQSRSGDCLRWFGAAERDASLSPRGRDSAVLLNPRPVPHPNSEGPTSLESRNSLGRFRSDADTKEPACAQLTRTRLRHLFETLSKFSRCRRVAASRPGSSAVSTGIRPSPESANGSAPAKTA